MRLAQTVPVLGSVLLVTALTAGALAMRSTCHRSQHRLVLHTYSVASNTYISRWAMGEVFADVTPGKLEPIRFAQKLRYVDHCQWMGVETLIPIDDRAYSYEYSETLLECEADGTPELTRKTPRTGLVVVE